LTISGTADQLEVHRPAQASWSADPREVAPTSSTSTVENGAHVGAISKLDATTLQIQAKAALTSLGWKSPIAHAAVAAAVGAMGNDLTLEQLIFEALRRCPAPRA
jgi:Holliday junction resolvasome RuvABC DNA-binding subunit